MKHSKFTYLRILSKLGLTALKEVLGAGIGLGLAVNRPTKQRPVGYCTINCIFTSIECGDVEPKEVVRKPRIKCTNGLDLIYSEENRILSCHIRYQKFTVTRPEDVTSRVPSAVIETILSGVYVETLFYYKNTLFEVTEIDDNNRNVKAVSVQAETETEIILPAAIVQQLVSEFGT